MAAPALPVDDARALWDASSDLFVLLDGDGAIVRANRAWTAELGWSATELVGLSAGDLLHPDDVELGADLRAGTSRIRAACGDYRWFSWNAHEVFGSWYSIGRDVGDAVAPLAELERAKALMNALGDGILVIAADGCVVDVNTVFSEITGFSREQVVGARPPYPWWPEDQGESYAAKLGAALSGEQRRFQVPLRHRAGRRLEILADVSRFHQNGEPGIVSVIRDVTDLVTARERLAEAHRVARLTSWEWDPAADRVTVFDNSLESYGLSADAFATLDDVLAALHSNARERYRDELDELLVTGAPLITELPVAVADAELSWIEMRAEPVLGEDGRVVLVRGTAQDISERKMQQSRLAFQAGLIDALDIAIVATDADGAITEFNHAAEQLNARARDDVIGRTVEELFVLPGDRPAHAAGLERVRAGEAWAGEVDMPRGDGSVRRVYVRTRPVCDPAGAVVGSVAAAVDVSERYDAELRLRSTRDFLRTVMDSVGEGLYALDAEGQVTYMNPAAERMLGWRADELLGRRMHDVIHGCRPDGTPYDAADCPILQAESGARAHGDDDTFWRRDGAPLPVAWTSTGIGGKGDTGCVVVFSDISALKAREERLRRDIEALDWVARIRHALVEDDFVLYAQPVVDVRTREVVQQEILLRMVDPLGAIVTPGRFIPPAERHGLTRDIDRWVIRHALPLAVDAPIQVNLSAQSLGDASLFEFVAAELEAAGADPRNVVFELTETALLQEERNANRFIERAGELGCRFALDDFGTGYGGFTYLKRLPVDYLKIDVEFVQDLTQNPASRHVVAAIVNLARGFGHRTVAEGVEDLAALEVLEELGVDEAQGFAVGAPRPLAAGNEGVVEEVSGT